MIGRADIEGSKSNVAMNAWLPQANYPCGNFSDTSSLKLRGTKGSIRHTFMICIHTENQNQGDFYPFVLLEISVLYESPLGHLRYSLTDVPPQPNSPPGVYQRLVESLHFDIQSTGQKSHCVNITFGSLQYYVLIRQSDSPSPYQF